jgi:predicted RNA binding protein YcfA (HicA-like mRNA interferase family)
MKLPRNVDGVDLANHLVRRWDYVFVKQTGSHMKLRTQVPFGHTATIPAHKPLKPGTLNGIISEVAEHKRVSRDEVLRGI